MQIPLQLEEFRKGTEKLPDLGRLLAKVFTYSVKDSVKAISFENVHHQKLREFKLLL